MPVLGVVAIIAGLLLQLYMPDGFPVGETKRDDAVNEIHTDGPVRINEVMASNATTLTDEQRKTPDWIEIANVGTSSVNIGGYKLAKRTGATNVFTFPEGYVLEAGACVIVCADGTTAEKAGEEFHAPFRISASGDKIMLFSSGDTAIDTVNIPALAQDTSYVRKDTTTWGITNQCTPGLLNTASNFETLSTAVATEAVRINEVVASNTQYARAQDGCFYDYIVLRNTGSTTIDISGYYLSDSEYNVRKWRFPDGVTIAAGEELIVYASGLNKAEDVADLHTNFRLHSEGEKLLLGNAMGQAIDSAQYDLLKKDTALLRTDTNEWTVGTPTK